MSLSGLMGVPGMGCACSGKPAGMAGIVSIGGGVGIDNVTGQTVAIDPSFAPGADATPLAPSSGTSAGDVARVALSVPGEVTGAFGLTPAQALQMGLMFSGRQVAQPPRPVAAPSSGIGLGAGLAIGGTILGLGYLLTRPRTTPAAAK